MEETATTSNTLAQQQALQKYDAEKLHDIIAELEMPESLFEQVSRIKTPTEALNYFTELGEFDIAVRFLALGLPKRERVWWGYICAEAAEKNIQDQKVQSIYKLIKEWVRTLGDEQRLAIQSLADTLGLYTPISWVGMGAFWSGGNIGKNSPYTVEASPFMSGHAIANAVTMAAEHTSTPTDSLKRFLRKGIHIAMGGNGRVD